MRIGEISVTPLAAESMGVRSMCTKIETPDIGVVLDPSAALAFRPPHEPHPQEYLALKKALERIEFEVSGCEILTISHYHFDHVRPGATNQRYNLCASGDMLRLYRNKRILAKDGRSNINPSQRRRAYYFERDLGDEASIEVADGKEFAIGSTRLTFSEPLPHGSDNTPLGYVLALVIEHKESRVLFAPDVQGPSSRRTLEYILSLKPSAIIIGGPPIYLKKFSKEENLQALDSLVSLAKEVEYLIVDHHLLRTCDWDKWLEPVKATAEEYSNKVLTMAEIKGEKPALLEAYRERLYEDYPPSQNFMDWLNAADEFKYKNAPPFSVDGYE